MKEHDFDIQHYSYFFTDRRHSDATDLTAFSDSEVSTNSPSPVLSTDGTNVPIFQAPSHICFYCKTVETPMWRRGPFGPATLCNACGVRWRTKKILTQYPFPEEYRKRRRGTLAHLHDISPMKPSKLRRMSLPKYMEECEQLMEQAVAKTQLPMVQERALTPEQVDSLISGLWETSNDKLKQAVEVLNHDLKVDIMKTSDADTVEIDVNRISDPALLDLWSIVMQ